MAGLVSYRYTDGRVKPPPDYVVTIGSERVKSLLAADAPIEVVAGHEFVGLKAKEAKAEKKAPKAEPKEKKAPEGDKKDGWPDGYSHKRAGAYLAVFDPDGKAVENPDAPSGKFRGENAAQEAAWNHKGGAA